MSLLIQTNSPTIKVRIAVYMLIIPILIFYVLAAVGCVSNSPGIASIFNFSYRDPSFKQSKGAGPSLFELRAGYFGICAGIAPALTCVSSSGSSTDQVVERISVNVDTARSNTLSNPRVRALLKIALDNQSKTISWVLLAGGIFFLLGLLFVLLLQFSRKSAQRKPTTARKMMVQRRLMLFFIWTSTALAFGASLATTQLAKIVNRTSASSTSVVANSLLIEPGTGLQVLQWLAATFSFSFAIGVSSIFTGAGGDQDSSIKGTSSLGSGDSDDF